MLVKGRGEGKGMLIYEEPSRWLHLQHPTTSLEEEWSQLGRPYLMGDHYYGASRTTETQQKEKVVEQRHLIHQVLCHAGHVREQY